MPDYVQLAGKAIKAHSSQLTSISNQLWDTAEIRFQEWRSAHLLCEELENEGFTVERGVGGLPTAFRASFGGGGPVIGFLGEYDALPGLSQQALTAQKAPGPKGEGGSGHGCGHHLLGTALLGAAIALKEYLQETGRDGTAVFYGCPAEEGGSGKVWMLRAGVFDEADILLSWHPDCISRVSPNDVLATAQMRYAFHGVAAHAALAPHLGRSALEAVELMGVGMAFLREHILPDVRVHYAIDNAGGSATNIIQPEASVSYQIRAPKIAQVQELAERIEKLARGAAMMTETEVDVQFQRATSELRVNETVNDVIFEYLQAFGATEATEEDLTLARQLYEAIPEKNRGGTAANVAASYDAEGETLAEAMKDSPLVQLVMPRNACVRRYGASTDVGDVSQIKPTGFLTYACFVKDIPLHTWQAVSFGKTHYAHAGMLQAARILGATAMCLADSPELVEKAKAEQRRQSEKEPYVCIFPEQMKPPIKPRPSEN